jgi:hypothetical protein
MLVATCAGAATNVAVCAQPVQPDITVEQLDLATSFTWGYRAGVKQPLGSYLNGRSVHQISRSNYPLGVDGNPDFLAWVDETSGVHTIIERPTDQLEIDVVNPGGQAAFDADGYIWFFSGARARDMPLDLYRSTAPFDATSFTVVLDDLVWQSASTTPCISIEDDRVLLYWRHEGSTISLQVRARVRAIERSLGIGGSMLQADVGAGINSLEAGKIGIEQLWSRFDPRYGYHMYSWQWFDVVPHTFGSIPFTYSDDAGLTWRHRLST